MAKLAPLPLGNGAPQVSGAEVHHIHRLQPRYYAFLSYSHRDKETADWLYGELERFRVPHALQGQLTANGVVPKRLTPIFRDEHELAAADDLGDEIRSALQSSQFLVVLCSPNAAMSRWTNAEIEAFKRIRPEGCILAAIVAGEPFASDLPGRKEEECLPAALRQKYDRRGRPTGKRAEPLAADLRGNDEQRRIGFLKLVAGMLGVGLDDLVQRETTRRQRRLAWLAAASLGGMAVTSTLAVTAIQARNEAREQRREAEGLVGFMLGDLKDKLEPIGRLDALDGVGARVLAYYQKQGTTDLSDAALSQRSKALSLMAQVAQARGDVEGALRLYRVAMAGTGETILRRPDDPQALFDHAQNVFYVGNIAQQREDFRTAEASMREYKRLALRMVTLSPDNMKWRMEEQYAEANLGILLFDQRRFTEAAAQFSAALTTIRAISTADSANQEYRKSVAESLAWLADVEAALGRYDQAISARSQDIALLEGLLARTGDVEYRQRLVPAHRALGLLYTDTGQRPLAIAHYRRAIAYADALTAVEPSNTQWRSYGYQARINLANELLKARTSDESANLTQAACETVRRLLVQDSAKPDFRKGLIGCWILRTRLSLQSGATEEALESAQRAVSAARSVHTGDRIADRFIVASALRIRGDAYRANGDAAAAERDWKEAKASLGPLGVEMPPEIAERANILRRLGEKRDSALLAEKLAKMGFQLNETA
jgi:tetratricopeptide (TPR) repeat protein